jgi:hypothetical protein
MFLILLQAGRCKVAAVFWLDVLGLTLPTLPSIASSCIAEIAVLQQEEQEGALDGGHCE